METWHVYQLRSDTELLYVGYTRRLKDRFREHKLRKSWWAEVTETLSEQFATEDEARQREKELWAAERPKYNRVNPFRTGEERRQYARDWQRDYDHTPEQRRHKQQYDRAYYLRRRALRTGRRWQQAGPGLF